MIEIVCKYVMPSLGRRQSLKTPFLFNVSGILTDVRQESDVFVWFLVRNGKESSFFLRAFCSTEMKPTARGKHMYIHYLESRLRVDGQGNHRNRETMETMNQQTKTYKWNRTGKIMNNNQRRSYLPEVLLVLLSSQRTLIRYQGWLSSQRVWADGCGVRDFLSVCLTGLRKEKRYEDGIKFLPSS